MKTILDKGKGKTPPGGKLIHRKIDETIESPDETAPDGNADGSFVETDDTRDFTGYDKTLVAYMEESGGVKDFTASLYKYDPVIKQKQAMCDTRKNDILSMHDVGMLLGSGEYRYLVTFPPETKIPPKAFKFNIHPIYDQYREKSGLTSNQQQNILHGGNGKSSMMETMEMMKMMVEIIKPMIPQPSAQINPLDTLMQSYSMTKEVLKNNLRENVGLYRELAKQQSETPEGDGMETETEEKGILDTILPLIDKFAPLLLGNNLQSQAAVAAVRALPEIKNVVKKPDELKKIIAAVEGELGKEKADRILARLKIKRPN